MSDAKTDLSLLVADMIEAIEQSLDDGEVWGERGEISPFAWIDEPESQRLAAMLGVPWGEDLSACFALSHGGWTARVWKDPVDPMRVCHVVVPTGRDVVVIDDPESGLRRLEVRAVP